MPFLRSLIAPILAGGARSPTTPPPTTTAGWEALNTSLLHIPAFDPDDLEAGTRVLYDRATANVPGQQYGDPVVSFVANHAYSKNLVYTIARRGGPEIAAALNLLLSTGNGTKALPSIRAVMAAARGHWQPNSSGGMLTFFDSADLALFGNDDMNFVQYRLNLTVGLGYYGAGMDALDRNRNLDPLYANEADDWFTFFHEDMREYWYNRPGLQDGSANPGDYLVVDRHFPHSRWSLINYFDCMARACARRGMSAEATAYRAERNTMYAHERGRYVPYQSGWFVSFSDSSPTNYFCPAYYYGHAVWHQTFMASQGYGFSLAELAKITWVVPNKLARPLPKGATSDSGRAPLTAHDGTESIFGADIGGNQASSDAGGDSQWKLSGTTLDGDAVTLTSAPASHDQYSSTGDNLTHTDFKEYFYGLAGLHHEDARDLNAWVYETQFGTSMSPNSNRLAGMQLLAAQMQTIAPPVEVPEVDTTAPSAPASLTASNVGSDSATLTWAASPESDTAGYRLYQDGVLVYDGPLLSRDVTGLTPETTYSFTVTAIDTSNNESSPSVAEEIVTPPTADTTPPSTPTNLVATGGEERITLTWTDPPEPDLVVIWIRRSPDGSTWSKFAEVDANEETFVDAPLPAGQTFHYQLRAGDGNNWSNYTSTASATPTGPDPEPEPSGTLEALTYNGEPLTYNGEPLYIRTGD